MDFKLQTDLNTLPSVIEFNYSELKAEMTERLKYYNNLVVSENSIKSAKADKANLNKLLKHRSFLRLSYIRTDAYFGFHLKKQVHGAL